MASGTILEGPIAISGACGTTEGTLVLNIWLMVPCEGILEPCFGEFYKGKGVGLKMAIGEPLTCSHKPQIWLHVVCGIRFPEYGSRDFS